jgi:riboflavin synthase
MFTGLIQDVGALTRLIPSGREARLELSTSMVDLAIGESVAVNGACLSVTATRAGGFTAFASAETISRTTLGGLRAGVGINLERATRAGEPLGGHLVTGHVDSVVRLIRRERAGEAERWTLSLPEDHALRRQIAPKGSVALDGVSLTVNEVAAEDFRVMIIPITLGSTTLAGMDPGREINLETDILAKYVARQLGVEGSPRGAVDLDLLRRSGFVRE